jgi:hypothetical protein
MGEGRIVSAETEIREAVSDKGKRYGELDAPYVVVVADCKEELAGGDRNADALIDAAFGSVVTQVRTLPDGQQEIKDVRIEDGYWGMPSARRHRNVSGMVLLPKPHLWDLREDRWQPLHLRNPWAERPLPSELLPLPGFTVGADGSIKAADGTRLADILGLPAVPDISTASNPHSITGGRRRDSGSVVTFPRAGVYPLDPRRFIKAFRNALLLRPVENPTDFVRNYVLDVPTIKVDRLRRSIELYRFLTGKIDGLKTQTASGCFAIIHRPVVKCRRRACTVARSWRYDPTP